MADGPKDPARSAPWKSLAIPLKTGHLQTVPDAQPIQPNPFASLSEIYEAARKASQEMTLEERVQDWIQNKPSASGSNSQRQPDTYVSPVTGHFVRI